jgi:hypothetical protein
VLVVTVVLTVFVELPQPLATKASATTRHMLKRGPDTVGVF